VLSDSSRPALPGNVVYQIAEDFKHRIYLFTSSGVARLTPRQPTSDDPVLFSVLTYTTEDGLPSNQCNYGSSLVDSNGRLWAGTIAGAAVLDPDEKPSRSSPDP